MDIKFAEREMTVRETYLLHSGANFNIENMIEFIVARAEGIPDSAILVADLYLSPFSELHRLFQTAAIEAMIVTKRACARVDEEIGLPAKLETARSDESDSDFFDANPEISW